VHHVGFTILIYYDAGQLDIKFVAMFTEKLTSIKTGAIFASPGH
jgi:hypothetical protein